MTKRLYDCATAVERLEWVRHCLNCGHTVTEAGLSLQPVAKARPRADDFSAKCDCATHSLSA